jgi:hypothetical protein
MDITKLSWAELNAKLIACDDLPTLQTWLDSAMAAPMSRTCVKRIYGRMNAVRRAVETRALAAARGKKAA